MGEWFWMDFLLLYSIQSLFPKLSLSMITDLRTLKSPVSKTCIPSQLYWGQVTVSITCLGVYMGCQKCMDVTVSLFKHKHVSCVSHFINSQCVACPSLPRFWNCSKNGIKANIPGQYSSQFELLTNVLGGTTWNFPFYCINTCHLLQKSCVWFNKSWTSLFYFPTCHMSQNNNISLKCPSLFKRPCVKMSLDKKGCVAVSHVSLFTHVDPYA